MERRRLVFRRTISSGGAPTGSAPKPGRHPLLGSMKGSVTFAPDYEPGEPADPDWGEAAYSADA